MLGNTVSVSVSMLIWECDGGPSRAPSPPFTGEFDAARATASGFDSFPLPSPPNRDFRIAGTREKIVEGEGGQLSKLDGIVRYLGRNLRNDSGQRFIG